MGWSQNRGIVEIWLLLICCWMMPAISIAREPTPSLSADVALVEGPQSIKPTVDMLPLQQAVANENFLFNLQPFIHESDIELRYQVRNVASAPNGQISEIVGTLMQVSGVPQGIIQISPNEGDCGLHQALSYWGSCILHFYVDRNQYQSLAGGYGPVVSLHESWRWGKHYAHEGGQNITAACVASQSIAERLSPIMRPTDIIVTPLSQDGLYYDASTSSITGVPTRTGVYHFDIGAINGNNLALSQQLTIRVHINPHDKPVFKSQFNLRSATPAHDYRLDLMTLLEPHNEPNQSNQVHFYLDTNETYPAWLHLDETATRLYGQVPETTELGQTIPITLIAVSNTGGESQPLTIEIPVALDLDKKPIVQQGIELQAEAGSSFDFDMAQYIIDPSIDGSLQMVLHQVEPFAHWISQLADQTTQLHVDVPPDAAGQRYRIQVSANTRLGGDSELAVITLQIAIDPEKTPRLLTDILQIPPVFAGQPYRYDFSTCLDVSPLYSSMPFVLAFASGYPVPSWLRIENNQLIADEVPDEIGIMDAIYVTITNTPGGQSEALRVPITIITRQ